jgi:hypothetical protein
MELGNLQGCSFEEIADALDWSDEERAHAKHSMGYAGDYQGECSMLSSGGREIRFPAYPAPCTYVRVCQAGFELAYWSAEEFREEPQIVLGAFLGAASRGDEVVEPSFDLCSDLKARQGLRSSLLQRRAQEG